MIEAPTDSYDERTCIMSTLTSLKTLMVTFDTAMDSLLESTNDLDKRLTSLHERTQKRKEILIPRENSQDRTGIVLMAPSTYPSNPNKERYDTISSRKIKLDCQQRQLEEQERAIPLQVKNSMISDSWLDRASAFEERQACFEALATNVMPSLTSSFSTSQEEEWKLSIASTGLLVNHHNQSIIHYNEQELQEQDVYSTTSASTTRTTATARERWNYHKYKKQQQLQMTKKHHQNQRQQPLPNDKSSSFRQEAMKGSLPYLCDVLHDAYSSIEEEQNPPRHIVKLFQQKQQQQKLASTQSAQSRSTENKISSEESDNHDDEKVFESTATVSIPSIPTSGNQDFKLPVLIDKHCNGHVSLPENLPL